MTALYLLSAEYRAAAMQLADMDLDAQTVADTLESIGGELEHKAQNVALMIRSIRADAEAGRQWAKSAADHAKATDARADHLTEYLARCMNAIGKDKLYCPGVRIGWRKSSAVVIDEPALLPLEFWRQKPPPEAEPDKVKIAAALKHGQEVGGAHIEHRRILEIR